MFEAEMALTYKASVKIWSVLMGNYEIVYKTMNKK